MNKAKRRIAIISISLGGGGAERFGGLLSSMLHQFGHEIHNIVVNDDVQFDYAGKLYNLGIESNRKSGLSRKFSKGFLLQKYLKENQIDCVIDNRSRNHFFRELFTKWIYGNRAVICIVHSFNLYDYFPKSVSIARFLYSKTKIVCVSKAIEEKIQSVYGLKNTITVYNPKPKPELHRENGELFPENFMLFFGRIDNKVKNFDLLMEAYAKSNSRKNNILLVIMGDGPDQNVIDSLIEQHDLKNFVRQIPFHADPFDYVSRARFTVLTSYYEGFPMSIVESLSFGTPVISVDCESGPKELITNGVNGLLVPNHNAAAFATAIDQFAGDGNLYDICKKNAASSVAHLSIENISSQWQQILLQL